MWNLSYQRNPLDTLKSMSCHPWCAVFLKCSPFANVNADIYVLWHLKYLDGFLAGWLGLVVLGLLVLLAALGQVGVVGQAAEKRRHHGAGVHLLLHRDNYRQEGWSQCIPCRFTLLMHLRSVSLNHLGSVNVSGAVWPNSNSPRWEKKKNKVAVQSNAHWLILLKFSCLF